MTRIAFSSDQILNKEVETTEATTERVIIIDMMRGIAMVLMALDHASAFAGVPLFAESYSGMVPQLGPLSHVLVGLITNLSSGIFFVLTGVSIAFFERSRRKRGWAEWKINRFFVIRGLVLIILNMTIVAYAWNGGPYFGVLSALAIDMVILVYIRHLPLRILTTISVSLLLIYPVLANTFAHAEQIPLHPVLDILFEHASNSVAVEYPVMGRLSLVIIGYVLGRLLQEKKFQITPRLLWLVPPGLLLTLLMRLAVPYGELTSYQSDQPWIYFFILSKQPPSIAFLLFNLSLSLVVLVAMSQIQRYIQHTIIGRALVILGQTALFFFVAHLLLYSKVISPLFPSDFLASDTMVRALIEFSIGMMIMIPVSNAYRKLRKKYPAILQYL